MGFFSKMRGAIEDAEIAAGQLKDVGSLGTLPAPGEGQVELPAGSIRISLVMKRPLSSSTKGDKMWRLAESKLSLSVEGPTGSVAVAAAEQGVSIGGGGMKRRTLATLQAPQAGSYTVVVSATNDWYEKRGCQVAFDAAV